MQSTSSEARSGFYVKPSEDNESIELVENFEMTNDFKQHVCLPYFKDLHKVTPQTLPATRICARDPTVPRKASTRLPSWT